MNIDKTKVVSAAVDHHERMIASRERLIFRVESCGCGTDCATVVRDIAETAESSRAARATCQIAADIQSATDGHRRAGRHYKIRIGHNTKVAGHINGAAGVHEHFCAAARV